MSILEIILIGVGLAMDAVAVSIANGMVYRNITKAGYISMPVMFGIFQMMMPVAGYYAGEVFGQTLKTHSGLVVLIILGVIGAKMVIEGLKKLKDSGADGQQSAGKKFSFTVVLLQAVATSIDAFAVGVGLSAAEADMWLTVSLIGIVTAIMVTGALFVGKKLGRILGKYSEIAGGLILILIGIKSFLA